MVVSLPETFNTPQPLVNVDVSDRRFGQVLGVLEGSWMVGTTLKGLVVSKLGAMFSANLKVLFFRHVANDNPNVNPEALLTLKP